MYIYMHTQVTTLIDREKYDGLTVYEPIAVLKEADYYQCVPMLTAACSGLGRYITHSFGLPL